MPDLIIAVYRRALDEGWPWDLGDDPSFEASARASGQIKWGVCRPPVRNAVSVGDLVVFFAGGRKVPCTYQFVGFAIVEQKISRDKIWTVSEFATFRSYRNILIRPEADGFSSTSPRIPVHLHPGTAFTLERKTQPARLKAIQLYSDLERLRRAFAS